MEIYFDVLKLSSEKYIKMANLIFVIEIIVKKTNTL